MEASQVLPVVPDRVQPVGPRLERGVEASTAQGDNLSIDTLNSTHVVKISPLGVIWIIGVFDEDHDIL